MHPVPATASGSPKVRSGGVVGVILLVGTALVATARPASAADTVAPGEAGTIIASNLTSSSVSLRWARSTDDVGIEGYRVYRGRSATSLSLIATTDAVTSYSATHLYANTSYIFGVTAIDAANNQSPMRTAGITTAPVSDRTPPAAPTGASTTVHAFSSSRIDITWGAPPASDLAGYRVYRNGAEIARIALPNGLRYSDNGLASGTSYAYSLKAVDSAGNLSAASTPKVATTLLPGSVVIARGPYVSNASGSSATISWWSNLATTGSVAIDGRTITDSSHQHHRVSITGLSPATSYPYTVTSAGVTATGTVRTAALPGQTFSFAAIGDFGGNSVGEKQNASNISGAGTEFIQTLGDNIYPSSGLPDPSFTRTYSDFDQRFFKQFSTAIRSQAFFPANGNKEYYSNGEFWTAFPMPGANHSWYSYDWGDAHILVLDSEQPFGIGTAQYSFAESDLATHQDARWRIVAIQRPPYSSATVNSSSKPVQQYLVPLFQTQHVQLVLSGNTHNYERTLPLLNGTPVTTGGVTYVVSGGGGNGFNPFQLAQPGYTAFREAGYYEFVKVTVSPDQIVVDAVRADTNAVMDSTTISA